MPTPLVASPSTLTILVPTIKISATPSTITEEMLSHYFNSHVVSPLTIGDTTPLLMHKALVTKHLSQDFLNDARVVPTLKLSLLNT